MEVNSNIGTVDPDLLGNQSTRCPVNPKSTKTRLQYKNKALSLQDIGGKTKSTYKEADYGGIVKDTIES